MNAQGAANTLNALSRLDAAASAMSPAGWDAVARAAERTAPTMHRKERRVTPSASKKLGPKDSVHIVHCRDSRERLGAGGDAWGGDVGGAGDSGGKYGTVSNSQNVARFAWACDGFTGNSQTQYVHSKVIMAHSVMSSRHMVLCRCAFGCRVVRMLRDEGSTLTELSRSRSDRFISTW
jgi:hypothetical protein